MAYSLARIYNRQKDTQSAELARKRVWLSVECEEIIIALISAYSRDLYRKSEKMFSEKIKSVSCNHISQKMEPQIVKRNNIIEDVNNNGLELSDSRSITEQDVMKYLEHYNAWKQTEWGHQLTCILRDYFGLVFDAEIKWHNVLSITAIHLIAIFAVLKYYTGATFYTLLWGKYFYK